MNINYQIWLTFNAEKEKLRFPVLPEDIIISEGTNDKTVNIAELGDIIVAQARPAIEISFSSFFPIALFPGLKRKDLVTPINAVKKIQKWKRSYKPVHFILTGLYADMFCRIKSFTYKEKGGDVGTLYFDITLEEYRDPKIRKVNVEGNKATVSSDNARTDNRTTPNTYTVKPGDCLWTIAKQLYGDGSKYMVIYEANKDIIGGSPTNYIYAGQVFKIPAI